MCAQRAHGVRMACACVRMRAHGMRMREHGMRMIESIVIIIRCHCAPPPRCAHGVRMACASNCVRMASKSVKTRFTACVCLSYPGIPHNVAGQPVVHVGAELRKSEHHHNNVHCRCLAETRRGWGSWLNLSQPGRLAWRATHGERLLDPFYVRTAGSPIVSSGRGWDWPAWPEYGYTGWASPEDDVDPASRNAQCHSSRQNTTRWW